MSRLLLLPLLFVGLLETSLPAPPAQNSQKDSPKGRSLRLTEVRNLYLKESTLGRDFDYWPVADYLEKEFSGWDKMKVVSKYDEADAVLTCQTKRRQVYSVADLTYSATVVMTDRITGATIWKTNKGPSPMCVGAFCVVTREQVSARILKQLQSDWEKSRQVR